MFSFIERYFIYQFKAQFVKADVKFFFSYIKKAGKKPDRDCYHARVDVWTPC